MPVAQESLLVVGAQDVFLAPTRTAFLEAMFTISGSGLANGGHVAYGLWQGSENTAAASQILIHRDPQMMSFADFAWAVRYPIRRHSNFNLRAHSTCVP